MTPETAKRAILARADTRALSRSASKRPAPPPGAASKSSTKKQLLANLMDTYTKSDVLSIEESIVQHVEYTLARSRYSFDDLEAYLATGYSLRDRLIEAWNDTNVHFKNADPKRVYYLSMEFLMGRSLTNALNNLGVASEYKEALSEVRFFYVFFSFSGSRWKELKNLHISLSVSFFKSLLTTDGLQARKRRRAGARRRLGQRR